MALVFQHSNGGHSAHMRYQISLLAFPQSANSRAVKPHPGSVRETWWKRKWEKPFEAVDQKRIKEPAM